MLNKTKDLLASLLIKLKSPEESKTVAIEEPISLGNKTRDAIRKRLVDLISADTSSK